MVQVEFKVISFGEIIEANMVSRLTYHYILSCVVNVYHSLIIIIIIIYCLLFIVLFAISCTKQKKNYLNSHGEEA